MPSPISSIASDVRRGRTFVRFQFDRDDINSLVADLNYATTPAVIQNAAKVRDYGRKVRDFLKANFPKHKTGARKRSSDIREGWRVEFYSAATSFGGAISSASSLWGFYLTHKSEQNKKVRTILNTIDQGSIAHMIYPGSDPRAKTPSDKLALKWSPGGGRGRMSKGHEVGGVRGYNYLAKTEKFASSLLAIHGNLLEDELFRITSKGSRLKKYALGASAGSGETIEDAVSSQSIISALLSQQSPLGAVKTLKTRLKARRPTP